MVKWNVAAPSISKDSDVFHLIKALPRNIKNTLILSISIYSERYPERTQTESFSLQKFYCSVTLQREISPIVSQTTCWDRGSDRDRNPLNRINPQTYHILSSITGWFQRQPPQPCFSTNSLPVVYFFSSFATQTLCWCSDRLVVLLFSGLSFLQTQTHNLRFAGSRNMSDSEK